MRPDKNLRNYYEEYLEVYRSVSSDNGILDLQKLLKKGNSDMSFCLPFGTCLIDYSQLEYIHISDHCGEIVSYPVEDYTRGGLNFHAANFHPEDRVIFSRQVFRDIRAFWKTIPAGEISQYRFSFNHRYIRQDGTEMQFMQRSTFMEPDRDGDPVLNLLTFTDISDFKKDKSLVLSVSRYLQGKGYIQVFSKSYPGLELQPLTKREAEILKLSLEGLSNKMIAYKLFLSLQTIKNHKRNMMEKTGTRNLAGMINLSLKNGWI